MGRQDIINECSIWQFFFFEFETHINTCDSTVFWIKVSQKVLLSTLMTLVCNAKIEISSLLTGHCTVVLHRYVAAHTVWKITHMSYFLTPMLDMPKKCQRLVKNEKLMEMRISKPCCIFLQFFFPWLIIPYCTIIPVACPWIIRLSSLFWFSLTHNNLCI